MLGRRIRHPMSGADLNREWKVIRPKTMLLGPVEEASSDDHPLEAEAEEYDSREVKRVCSPCKPSLSEVDHHNSTHLPYRSWCRHCVKGRGKEAAHQKARSEAGDVPEFHFDWCFPGEE